MSDLRDDLYPILQDVKHVPLGDSLTPIADRILAAVREALLSDDAVEAAKRKMLGPSPRNPGFGVLTPERAITAALDAARGEGA